MNKKSVLAAIFLVTVGIIFGALLVSNFTGGMKFGFAGDENVQLGAPSKVHLTMDSKGMGKAFVAVSKAVTPTVVFIKVVTKGESSSDDNSTGGLQEFFRHFGPGFKFEQPEPQMGAGSGVIINPNGYILTNNHVVENAADDGVEVVLSDTRTLKAKVVGTDPTTDLAVIKVDADDLPTASFGDSDSLEVGDWVLAIGNPLGLQSTVTAGIVSYIGRNIGIINDQYKIENFIQTDAAINPGNSGGPLVNLNGEVIGINSAIATTNARYQGYGFAIPINMATTVASDIIKYGKVRRGYIGVTIQDVDETSAKAIGLDKAHGALIQSVSEDGAASEAGIKEGDVILAIDGKQINQSNDLQSTIARHHPGDVVSLQIFRDGKKFTKEVTLRSRTGEAVAAKDTRKRSDNNSESDTPVKTASFTEIGFSVKNLTNQQKEDAEIDNGVLVTEVKTYSQASQRGIQKGDIILEANKSKLNSVKELKSMIEGKNPGDAILMRVRHQNGQTNFIAVQIPK